MPSVPLMPGQAGGRLLRLRGRLDAALKPLGYACLSEDAALLGYGRDAAGLWILAAKNPVHAV
jgi:hypothetical protein